MWILQTKGFEGSFLQPACMFNAAMVHGTNNNMVPRFNATIPSQEIERQRD